jgi:hypothetical protein
MKNTGLKAGMLAGLLVFVTLGAAADVFSRTFNTEYPIYGFNLIGYQKSPTAGALAQTANFAAAQDTAVLLDYARVEENGKYKIKLTLRKGLTRVASLELVLQSDAVTRLNYITRLDFYDFSTFPRRNVEIDWNGREARLDDIMKQFGGLLNRFYNAAALVS